MIASLILFFVLIPVYIATSLAGIIVAAVPGLIAYGIAEAFTITPLAVIIGVAVGMPFLFTVLFSPLIFVDVLVKVFTSSVWTLTYREILVLQNGAEPVKKPATKRK